MINLLPPQCQKDLLEEENCRLVLVFGFLILFFLVFLILILFSAKIQIEGQLKDVQALKILEEEEFKKVGFQEMREKIKLTNQNFEGLDLFYQKQEKLIQFQKKFSEILPNGIYLTQLSLNRLSLAGKEYEFQVFVSGFCPTREMLFNLKESLEAEKGFRETYLPPASWTKPSNIEFNLTFKVDDI